VSNFEIRPLQKDDKDWVASLLTEWWASPKVVTLGGVHRADELPGFIASQDGRNVGLITYDIVGDRCEIVTMNSLVEGIGIGSALIDTVREAAVAAGCRRLWLVTTNDNTHALRFYQKRGFLLVSVHRNVVEQWRRTKPEIPYIGNDGIPVRDAIELEIVL
jgi:ribosomal protein S18 acetylase RimI-like enzyme